MRYLPHTEEDIREMLQVVGASSLEALFAHIPEACRRSGPMRLPEAMSEWDLEEHLQGLSGHMASDCTAYLGAGSYSHFIPAVVGQLASRSEFVTSYTPYQPEMTQGTLQAIFEYQTLTARLLEMDVANASMYDGASALAEALLMAIRITRKKKVALSPLIHPHYRKVVETYFGPTGYELVVLPRLPDGQTDISGVEGISDLAAVALQSPNFFGCMEDLAAAAGLVHQKEALLVAGFTEPLAFGLYEAPGRLGADIACGEGQSFGIPATFGGPSLGMFACRMTHVRNMPGRLVGQTVDADGRRGFVLTLATREQHIRREKATSNICTNNSLCALTASVYLAALGGSGLRDLARINYDKTEYLKSALRSAGLRVPFGRSTFNEFVVELPAGAYQRLLAKKIVAGVPLDRYFPELSGHVIMCVTETRNREEMDIFVDEVTS